jgi:hypothetical protein
MTGEAGSLYVLLHELPVRGKGCEYPAASLFRRHVLPHIGIAQHLTFDHTDDRRCYDIVHLPHDDRAFGVGAPILKRRQPFVVHIIMEETEEWAVLVGDDRGTGVCIRVQIFRQRFLNQPMR